MDQLQVISYMSPIGYQGNTCGYCHSRQRRSSRNYYAWSDKVDPVHYQELVDRGWRRSGTTWYKPDVRNACCPHYTIRIPVSEFRPSRDQRQAVHRFNNDFVLGLDYKRKAARLCPQSREQKRFRRNNFPLCEAIHESEYTSIKRPTDPNTKEPIEPARKFEVTLEPDTFTAEKYALFADYQKEVHHEPPYKISKGGFKSFLCSGMGQSTYNLDDKPRPVGSYHQCYRIDGELVAIGVLDLLPDCVSSVYLIYRQDVSDLEFGKLSALREVVFAKEGGYKYYYMGYYIHSCIKMRYKRTFKPTYVLDPETYSWNPLDNDMAARMSVRKYVSLSRENRLGLQVPTEQEVSEATGKESAAEQNDSSIYNSVFDVDMPGIMTKEEVSSKVSPGDLMIVRGENVFTLSHSQWGLESTDHKRASLLFVAEFVACIGQELASEIALQVPDY